MTTGEEEVATEAKELRMLCAAAVAEADTEPGSPFSPDESFSSRSWLVRSSIDMRSSFNIIVFGSWGNAENATEFISFYIFYRYLVNLDNIHDIYMIYR